MGSLAVVLAAVVGWGAPTAAALPPTTTRASLSSSGAQSGSSSTAPQLSADGRWVAFIAEAGLVTPDTNQRLDVFLRDRLTGETRRISDGPGGAEANDASDAPVMTPDGRYVAFSSRATNLVAGGTTGRQLFLYDRTAGTLRPAAALPPGVLDPSEPSLSADGARVLFRAVERSRTGEVTRADILVAETATGVVRRITQTTAGAPADAQSGDPDLSDDGRLATFATDATNLVTPDTNGVRDVIATDLQTGRHERVSVGSAGSEANQSSFYPSASFDGCLVAFLSNAGNLVAGDDGVRQAKAFVRNRCQPETEAVSVSNGGTQGFASSPPDISADGCFVTFVAGAILSPAPTPGTSGVALRDRCAGVTSRVDVATTGDPGNGLAFDPVVSATGRYVAFSGIASNLVPGDTNGQADVFVRDRATNRKPQAELVLAQEGSRVTADATASSDVDGPAVTGRISFGDGGPEVTGLRAVHDYPRSGSYTVTVIVTDADDMTSTKSLPVTVSTPPAPPAAPPAGVVPARPPVAVAPALELPELVLDRVGLSRRRFMAVRRGAKPGGSRGSQLTLRLSEPATVELRFERASAGRRSGSRCVARRRRGSRCTRWVTAGTLRRALGAGTRTVLLTGRLGTTTLRAGSHRLGVVARSADGRRSARRTLLLTIIRPRSSR